MKGAPPAPLQRGSERDHGSEGASPAGRTKARPSAGASGPFIPAVEELHRPVEDEELAPAEPCFRRGRSMRP